MACIVSEVRLRGRDDSLETRAWVLPSIASKDQVFVIVHGLGLSHRVYGRLAARLAEHGRVVGVDLPGFGGTRRPTRAVSVHELAQCLNQSLSDAKVESAVLVGHSMGVQIALELALMAPSRVDALVLIGPVVNPRQHSLIQQMLALARDTTLEPWATKLTVLRDYITCGISWYLTETREMMRYRTDLNAIQLDLPLLVVRGQNDVIAPVAWCDWLAIHGTIGRAESVARHRHVVAHSAPKLTADLIADFARTSGARNAN